ncbi:MAG: DMT family transporter [Rhizobiaceae bacterium]
MKNGILLALVAYAVYAWSDGFTKALGPTLSVFQIGFFTFFLAGIALLFMPPTGERWWGFWRMQRPWAVHLRAVLGVTAGIGGVHAFTTIPLAEAYALVFLAPLFITLLSIVLLGEQVGPWRWAAVIAGFCGVLLVVRPGFRELQLGHLSAMAVAVLFAGNVILMRSLANEKQTSVIGVLILYTVVINGVAALATGALLPPADWQVVAMLIVIGIFTAIGSRLLLLATRLTPVNQLAPTHYSQILWAVAIGAAFFEEYPDWLSILGLAVVAGSGLLTLVRERIRLGTVRWNPFARDKL